MSDSPRKRAAAREEYTRLLNEHKDAVRAEGGLMRKAIASGSLKDCLKHATGMLDELRTSSLTPKLYYELFLDIHSQLNLLESFFSSSVSGGGKLTSVTTEGACVELTMHDVYHLVQHAEKLIPRLYLQITAGSVYIKCGQVEASVVLEELLKAVSGVQHPMRGLFVRYYLAQCMRDKLPDAPASTLITKSLSPTPTGTILNSISFLLGLLRSMNRLWVRLGASSGGVASVLALVGSKVGGAQNSNGGAGSAPASSQAPPPGPPPPAKKKRTERERLELRVLLGSILSRMASLENLDFATYAREILPGILGEVVACKDRWAQAYLFEATLQVFPVEWHEASLGSLMHVVCCGGVVADPAMVRVIIQTIMSRMKEGGVLSGDDASSSASASSSALPSLSFPSNLAVAAPPLPPQALLSPLPPEFTTTCKARPLAVFKVLLAYIHSVAALVGGPFLPAELTPSPDSTPSSATPEPTLSPEAPTPLPPNPQAAQFAAPGDHIALVSPPPSSDSSTSLSLKTLHSYSVALEGLLNVLDVYTSLLCWCHELLGSHAPLVDAVLGAAASSVKLVMGVGTAGGGSSEDSPLSNTTTTAESEGGIGCVESSPGIGLRLSPRAVEAMKKMLELGAVASNSSGDAAKSSAAAANSSSEALIRALTAASSSTGMFSISISARPRLFLDTSCSSACVSLLAQAGRILGLSVLSLPSYATLFSLLAQGSKRTVAGGLLSAVVQSPNRLAEPAIVGRLFEVLKPLLRPSSVTPSIPEPLGDGPEATTRGDGRGMLLPPPPPPPPAPLVSHSPGGDGEENGGVQLNASSSISPVFKDETSRYTWEQGLLRDLVLLLGSSCAPCNGSKPSLETCAADFAVYEKARDALAAGGSTTIGNTFPLLISRILALGEWVSSSDSLSLSSPSSSLTKRSIAMAVNDTIRVLAVAGFIEEAVVQLCEASENTHVESRVSNEFLCQAHIMFEELPNSSSQSSCLSRIITATSGSPSLTPADRRALFSRAIVTSDRILRRAAAVDPLLACASSLAALPASTPPPPPPPSSNASPLFALQKAIRAADAASPVESPPLFLQCLNTAILLSSKTPSGGEVIPHAFLVELAIVAREYVAWALRPGSSYPSKLRDPLGIFYEKLVSEVKGMTGASIEALSSHGGNSPSPLPSRVSATVPSSTTLPKLLETNVPQQPPNGSTSEGGHVASQFAASDAPSSLSAQTPTRVYSATDI